MKFCLTILLIYCAFLLACTNSLPEKSTENYKQAVSAFYVGLAALQVGDDQRAGAELKKAGELAKAEPSIWNNLGVLQLRQKDFENAAASLETAKNLAPDNAMIYSNLAILEIQRGDFDKAIENLTKTIELNHKDFQAIYALAKEYERQTKDAESLKLFHQIKQEKPENLALKLEIARLSAKLNNAEILKQTVEELGKNSENWSLEIKEQFENLKSSVESNDLKQVSTKVAFLSNVLVRNPEFRAGLAEIKPSDTAIGTPLLKPLKLPTPDFSPAEADTTLTFSAQTSENVKANFAKAIFLDGAKPPVIAWADEKETHIGETVLPFGLANSNNLTAFDFDYDYKNDLAIADEKGFRLFKQTEGGKFKNVTEATKLSSEVLSKPYNGVWVLDVDNEGDLDLFLATKNGEPIVLQNNGDGTFTETKPFNNVENIIEFAYADLDEDGDSDAVLLMSGKLQIFSNERSGLFKERNLPKMSLVSEMNIGDINGDNKLDLVFEADGLVQFLTDKNSGEDFDLVELFKTEVCETEDLILGRLCDIQIADFDNNGGNDILISSQTKDSLFLVGKDGKFSKVKTQINGTISNSIEINNDGKLDLIGIDGNLKKPTVFQNTSTKNYHWQILKPKSAKTEGDQRINPFGIGGEIEVRSGLLSQKQLINSPQVHFGLGEMSNVDVARIIWQNGYVQAEFDLKPNQTIAAEQRLKGSCPHLFAWNGKEFAHVKDAPPWSPALGLKINAQDTYGILQTEEWFKIPGEALKAKDGFYELRITGEYWESFYLDNYKLLAVDHPEDTEIFTDERFAIPLPPLKVFTTEKTNLFAKATDHNGRDVLQTVSALDEKYLDGIKRGKFQGVAEDHFVELELPTDAPTNKKLWLIADGWVHPTDASINVQRGQSTPNPPKSLSIEVEDKDGNWNPAKENLGFPAGKMKTVLLDLSDIFTEENTKKRFRLRTEMEIFWDKLAWTVDLPENDSKIKTVNLAEASLRYRGFSVIEKSDDSSPEVPVYDIIMTTNQRWRDLEGFYTRFGDVKELLDATDDRFVLANAGDELLMKFPALPEVEKGWKRDFVIIGNGWIKDGDLNSVFSKTLLPLPTQQTSDYTRRPTTLEDDPVYEKNKLDWVNFHTRYVSPDSFRNALRK